MTHLEATDLATRILASFNGPPADVWEEELVHLEAGRVGTALARARREHDGRWLTVARFLEYYKGVHSTNPTTQDPPCAHCDDTGWVQAADRVTDDDLHYTQVRPCTCKHGRRAEQSAVWRDRRAA